MCCAGIMDVAWQAEALAAQVAEPVDRVQRLLLRNPAALVLGVPQLATAAITLASALSLGHLQALAMIIKRPVLMQAAPAHVQARCMAVGEIISLATEEVAALAARQPALLDVPLDSWRLKISQMAAALEVTPAAMALMLSRTSGSVLRMLLAAGPQVTIGLYLNI